VRALDHELVQEVWQTLCDYEPERSEAEARAFIKRQPHLIALAKTLMEEFDVGEQKAALGLLFLLTKVLEAHREAPVTSVSAERVARAYEAAVAWVERWSGTNERFLARSGEFPQPHLIPYLISVLSPGDAGRSEYEAEVQGSLFLLLKAAADAIEAGEIPGESADWFGEGEGDG